MTNDNVPARALKNNPFRYVYGLEIVDASIPITMYQIDKTNNNLKIKLLSENDVKIYKEVFKSKSKAISREYYIKKNKTFRNKVKNKYK